MKINRNTKQTQKKKARREFRTGIRKNKKWYQGNKKGHYEQKQILTRNRWEYMR